MPIKDHTDNLASVNVDKSQEVGPGSSEATENEEEAIPGGGPEPGISGKPSETTLVKVPILEGSPAENHASNGEEGDSLDELDAAIQDEEANEKEEDESDTDEDTADVGLDDPVTLGGMSGDNPNADAEKKALSELPNDGIHPANLSDEESVDDFILTFFEMVDKPTDRQIHFLALALGTTPEEFEDKVYALMSKKAKEDSGEEASADDDDEGVLGDGEDELDLVDP